ncbi:uncharacterized protein [Centruroides vittatus]|uniref:uncharacterized protein isoform X1 n=2 Tax=Centruroides vittatus TaxID=120091 RepID=UPI00350FA667
MFSIRFTAFIFIFLIILIAVLSGRERYSKETEKLLTLILSEAFDCCNAVKNEPFIALSSEHLMQAIALLKHLNEETICGREMGVDTKFDIIKPWSWNFCVEGDCNIKGNCICNHFVTGKTCNIFTKNCWLYYCGLQGCESQQVEKRTLTCFCNSSHLPTTTGIFWYDGGLDIEYIAPHRKSKNEFTGVYIIKTILFRRNLEKAAKRYGNTKGLFEMLKKLLPYEEATRKITMKELSFPYSLSTEMSSEETETIFTTAESTTEEEPEDFIKYSTQDYNYFPTEDDYKKLNDTSDEEYDNYPNGIGNRKFSSILMISASILILKI